MLPDDKTPMGGEDSSEDESSPTHQSSDSPVTDHDVSAAGESSSVPAQSEEGDGEAVEDVKAEAAAEQGDAEAVGQSDAEAENRDELADETPSEPTDDETPSETTSTETAPLAGGPLQNDRPSAAERMQMAGLDESATGDTGVAAETASQPHRSLVRRLIVPILAIVVIVIVVVAVVMAVGRGSGGPAIPTSGWQTARPFPTVAPSSTPEVVGAVPKADPQRIVIPDADVDAAVELYTVDMAKRSNNPLTGAACYSKGRIACVNPPDVNKVYWEKAGVGEIPFGDQPGTDSTGTVYMAGHASGTKDVVFNDLYTLKTGDPVDVTTANGTVRYLVEQVVVLGKSSWSTSEWANAQVPGRLVLATCYHADGAKVAGNGSSTQNVLVIAQVPATSSLG